MTIQIRGGSVMGRDHLLLCKNSQDSFAVWQGETESKPLFIGIISDGCGSTKRSEVGAHLITAFLLNILKDGENASLRKRVRMAVWKLLTFLRRITKSFVNQEEFIFEHLLATTLGIVSDGHKVLVFFKGDGYIFLGNEALEINENNQPNYLAYEIPKRNSEEGLGFHFLELSLMEYPQIAISTDGFEPEQIELFWEKSHPNGVQRQLNTLSRKKHFGDDATIVTIEKLREVGQDEDIRKG